MGESKTKKVSKAAFTKRAKTGLKINAASPEKKSRALKPPKYKPWHIGKRIKPQPQGKLTSGWQILIISAKLVWGRRLLFLGIGLIYGVLNLILVRGLGSSVDVQTLKNTLDQASHGQYGQLGTGLSVFTVLLGSSGAGATASANVYQFILVVLVSLAVIWSLRQILLGSKIRVRDGFYLGMYPLVPFLLVLFVVALELLPLLAGADLYSIVMSNGIAVNGPEIFGCTLVLLLLAAWSFYMLCSGIMAIYIVTLPKMTPLKALRSARELVRYRRPRVILKLMFLPLVLLIVAGVIMLPVIIWLAPAARWIFFVLATFAIVPVHAYMYTLYRELL